MSKYLNVSNFHPNAKLSDVLSSLLRSKCPLFAHIQINAYIHVHMQREWFDAG